jgi:ABC-type glutathione transport system ATPase component
MSLILVVRRLKKTPQSERLPVRALRPVDPAIEEGESFAATGSSGAGKSTLAVLSTLVRHTSRRNPPRNRVFGSAASFGAGTFCRAGPIVAIEPHG